MQNILNDSSAVRCEIIVGTRPEAIKLAPVIKALRESGGDFLVRVVTSGQHGAICRSALAAFVLTADSELEIEPITGSLAESAGAPKHSTRHAQGYWALERRNARCDRL